MPKGKAEPIPNTGKLMVNIFDGTQQPIAADVRMLVRVRDGNQKEQLNGFYKAPSLFFDELPFYNNFGDNYAVVVSANGYVQAGYTPIKIAPNTTQKIDLMLMPANGSFNFHDALWPALQQNYPAFAKLLAHGAASDAAAQTRYSDLMEKRPASLACFFNLATAMSAINLPVGNPLDYIKEVVWDDSFASDRFFGWTDPKIIDQIKLATQQGEFAPEVDPGLFHDDATSSWKQIQFGEANVQLTFHETDKKKIDGLSCVKIEPDIDYYKDLGAHFLLEVLVNTASHSLTDPKQVYVLRWIAGRHAGVAGFNPPYTVV
jgi:hypothetical protein